MVRHVAELFIDVTFSVCIRRSSKEPNVMDDFEGFITGSPPNDDGASSA